MSAESDIIPDSLVGLLVRLGWSVTGKRTGKYVRLSPPASYGVLVPVDSSAPDYLAMMAEAEATLSERYRDQWPDFRFIATLDTTVDTPSM